MLTFCVLSKDASGLCDNAHLTKILGRRVSRSGGGTGRRGASSPDSSAPDLYTEDLIVSVAGVAVHGA